MSSRLQAGVLLFATLSELTPALFAQSTAAALFGSVVDIQDQRVPGASVSVRSVETQQLRATASDDAGRFRVLGLPPGLYEVRVELSGFEPDVRTVTLTIAEEARVDSTLRPATVRQTVSVSNKLPALEASRTIVGRTIVGDEIDALPVAGRDFTSLALLTPGVLANQAGNLNASSGIVAAGQTGRSNTFLLDGLSLDDTFQANPRGGVPLDAVREFGVLTDGYTAQYGHASGAIVSVVTQSGTNRLVGRGTYLLRDRRWDAQSAAARLVVPAPPVAPFAQKTPAFSLGGPIRRDRAFFFGAVEGNFVDTASIVTTPLLAVYRPGLSPTVPWHSSRWQAFGRGDTTVGSDRVTVQYRSDRAFGAGGPRGGKMTPETQNDGPLSDQDVSLAHTHVWTGGVNELRVGVARRSWSFDRGSYCSAPCPPFSESRPGIQLGVTTNEADVGETYWQASDLLSTIRAGRLGEHTLSAGADVMAVGARFRGASNQSGTFSFNTNTPFDAGNPATYPFQYTQTLGNADLRLRHTLTALFLQDRWMLRRNLTVNLGIRWDYDSLAGVSHDWNNLAPRLGLAFNPDRTGRTVLRASYGIYYDQMFEVIVRQYEQTQQTQLLLVTNPGYPDWRAPNPNRGEGVPPPTPNTRQLGDLDTPHAERATAGVQRSFGSLAVTVDASWARGRNLFATRDVNAPDGSGIRPDPRYQFVRVVESQGHSWYRALELGATKRWARSYALSTAYTLSRAERDTEEFDFTPQVQGNLAAERGPSTSNVRHQFVGSGSAGLPFGAQIGLLVIARSAAPYNITAGVDNNHDGTNNDRPPGVTRNSARGTGLLQIDARLVKSFRLGRARVDLTAEAFNLTNRPNWTTYDGVQTDSTFGRPLAAAIARQIQLGLRIQF